MSQLLANQKPQPLVLFGRRGTGSRISEILYVLDISFLVSGSTRASRAQQQSVKFPFRCCKRRRRQCSVDPGSPPWRLTTKSKGNGQHQWSRRVPERHT